MSRYGAHETVQYLDHITEEVTLDGVPLYRYNLSENVFDRVKNGTDCYATENALPDGISDASKCFYGKCTFDLYSIH